MRISRPRKGFTLIELLITITIFSLLITLGVLSYLNLTLALKRENIQRKLYSEVESILDDMQRLGKFYAIDYDWYTQNRVSISPGTGNEDLVLISKDRTSRIHFKTIAEKETLGVYKEIKKAAAFEPEKGFSESVFEPLTSQELHIRNARFFLFPAEDKGDFQQKITIALTGSLNNPFRDKEEEFKIQTTFSSRLYSSSIDNN